MDKATEYLILQEAKWADIVNNLKTIIPSAQKVFLKPNLNTLKTISKRLKGRKLKDIEREAIRTIPGFKKDFAEAQGKASRLKFVDNYTSKGVALATALVSSSTGKDVSDVMKRGEMGVRSAKILPLPGLFQMLAFGLFVTFLLSIYVSGGESIGLAIQALLKIIGLLVMILGQIVKTLVDLLGGVPKDFGVGPAIQQVLPGLEGDPINLQQLLQQNDILGYSPIS